MDGCTRTRRCAGHGSKGTNCQQEQGLCRQGRAGSDFPVTATDREDKICIAVHASQAAVAPGAFPRGVGGRGRRAGRRGASSQPGYGCGNRCGSWAELRGLWSRALLGETCVQMWVCMHVGMGTWAWARAHTSLLAPMRSDSWHRVRLEGSSCCKTPSAPSVPG